ncbi:MCP four helix bundle domain-containing protein [Telmatocola sphagniphila]|uniref:histidine kinase n=1 Tax=Telmatocola sphagniphila TaxID=1123043 RepID=A0A8E6B716_9BACT|nr:ATP-binding protein [Telmatocola sphagniphila]QVL33300.1 MCP four helix bundle domain-containing protein [Telmatocola sphagniphila]
MAFKHQMILKVTMPSILIAMTLLATSFIGIRSMNRLQERRDSIISEHVARLQLAQDLETHMRRIRLHSLLYIMEPIPERRDKLMNDQAAFEKALSALRETVVSPTEQDLIAGIDKGYQEYLVDLKQSVSSPPTFAISEFMKWADSHPIKHIVNLCEEVLNENRASMKQTTEETREKTTRTRSWMVVLGVVGACGGLIGGFGVAWGLSRVITRLKVRLQDVHAHLDQEVASLRFTAESGDLKNMELQVGKIYDRVRIIVDQLQRQERDSIRAEQLAAVGQLAAGIAHEVRNPLTSIKLLVGAALSQKNSGGLSETDLKVIHEEVVRVEKKVQALLDFARPQNMDVRPTDLVELIYQFTGLIKSRLQQQKVDLELDLPDSPVMCKIDSDQFKGLLVNLSLNALDVMPSGGEIKIQLRTEADGSLELDMCDTGPGIDPLVIDRLFTPFVSNKPTGTGLGLSISRQIVQNHGGTLTAFNQPEGGACFRIHLPKAFAGALKHADTSSRR